MKTSAVNLEAFKEVGVAGFEAARTLGELNLRTWEKLVEKQAEAFGLFVDAGIELVKTSTEQKDIKELVNAEMNVAKQFGENLVVKGREALQVANDARDDYRSWAEQGVETFTKQVNSSVKAA
ncbi:MAG: phasin family protein [Sedimenticola sp.]|nr:phasin family protein [Sedimenticola sp.]